LINIVSWDVETTTKNKGHPFDPDNKLISFATQSTFHYYTDPNFYGAISSTLDEADEWVGFNIKFDIHWVRRVGYVIKTPPRIWDCQIAEFVIRGQTTPYISLNECLESYNIPLKEDKVASFWKAGVDTPDIPVAILEEYNIGDSQKTLELRECQQQVMSPEQINLVYIMGEDLLSLEEAEFNGVKWDTDAAQAAITTLFEKVSTINDTLNTYLPDIKYGKFNWSSGDHLSVLIYGGSLDFDYSVSSDAVYKSGDKKGQEYVKNSWFVENIVFPGYFKPLPRTEVKKTKDDPQAKTRFYKVDDPTLSQLTTRGKEGKTLLSLLQQRAELEKVAEMLVSIEKKRNQYNWGEYLHGQFNQTVVITGRLSSSNP